jgi:hypothetical protein
LENFSLLKQLLYSPNIILSIHSMNALLFLGAEGKIKLSPDIIMRMESIVRDESDIKWQYSDVGRKSKVYEILKATKSRIDSLSSDIKK